MKKIALPLVLLLGLAPHHVWAAEPIKVGIIHSDSGALAVSEQPLRDLLLFLIERTNQTGGLVGRQLQPVLVDPASDDTQFAQLTRRLLTIDKVDVIFGGWTSSARKAMVPIVEDHKGLLFYSVAYEGEESSRSIIYTGAVPNQVVLPAIDYLRRSRHIDRWVLVGNDYVYSWGVNQIIRSYLKQLGAEDNDILETYGFDQNQAWGSDVAQIRDFIGTTQGAVLSTINGDANRSFFAALRASGSTADILPVMSFALGETEIRSMPAADSAGHFAARSYFQSLPTEENRAFVAAWQKATGDDKAITSDPMEATAISFQLWKQAVIQGGDSAVATVRQALYRQSVVSASGYALTLTPSHQLAKPAMIGRVRDDGSGFDVVWQSRAPIDPAIWSPLVSASPGLKTDWAYPWLCSACLSPTYVPSGLGAP